MKLSPSDEIKERALLMFCKEHQGPAINVLNRSRAPNATTYRSEFCDAAADLFRLYRDAEIRPPLVQMSLRFVENGIRSCRGNEMTLGVIDYFYKEHLSKRLSGKQYLILEKIIGDKG